MATFIQSIVDRIFGHTETEEVLPDDGGLAEFAKQYAAQLAYEEKHGATPGVAGNSVLHVQQGRHGSRAYLLDTTDFKKATMKELRLSIPPVTEGILKSRCGEKGKGYMNVSSMYVFNVKRKDSVEEYNAAMDIIDDIGHRLLGDRYVTGERKIAVPVAHVDPGDLLKDDGSFNMRKAKKAVNLVRDAQHHGPADIDWKTNEVRKQKENGEWETQHVASANKTENKEWQTQHHQKSEPEQKEWERLEHKPQEPKQSTWQAIKSEGNGSSGGNAQTHQPHAATTEQSWGDIPDGLSQPTQTETEASEPAEPIKPKVIPIQPARLRQIGEVELIFRPSWDSEKQKINTYFGWVRCTTNDDVIYGQHVYPTDLNDKYIHRIDKAIAKQAAQHLEQTPPREGMHIVIPVHYKSLLEEERKSPLKPLRDLDDEIRKAIWIEILWIDSNASPKQLTSAIKSHHDKFDVFGLRLEVDQISKPMIQRTGLQYISCDLQSNPIKARTAAAQLPQFRNTAREFNLQVCCWNIQAKKNLQAAIKNHFSFINGPALAKSMAKPGKIIPVTADKILGK